MRAAVQPQLQQQAPIPAPTEFDMAEMRAEIERQANEFVQAEITKKQAALQQQFEQAVN